MSSGSTEPSLLLSLEYVDPNLAISAVWTFRDLGVRGPVSPSSCSQPLRTAQGNQLCPPPHRAGPNDTLDTGVYLGIDVMKDEVVFLPSLVSPTTGFPWSQMGCFRRLERQRPEGPEVSLQPRTRLGHWLCKHSPVVGALTVLSHGLGAAADAQP